MQPVRCTCRRVGILGAAYWVDLVCVSGAGDTSRDSEVIIGIRGARAALALALFFGVAVAIIPTARAAAFFETPGLFHAAVARILDTRFGRGGITGPVAAHRSVVLDIDRSLYLDLPQTGVAAIALNVTVTSPSRAGNIAVYPDGTAEPASSNVNFVPGQTVANLVIARVGSDGRIDLANNSPGPVQLIADAEGYYDTGTPTIPGAFVATIPARLLDTRTGTGAPRVAVAPGATIVLKVAGAGAVPVTVPGAVAMNVTVTGPSRAGKPTRVIPYDSCAKWCALRPPTASP